MKSASLIVILTLGGVAFVMADPAPKLVPRPIPGLEMLQPNTPPSISAPRPSAIIPSVPTVSQNPDQARVVFIHRRATLPAELTKDLPVRDKKIISSFQLQVKQGPIKIIPKQRLGELDLAKAQNE